MSILEQQQRPAATSASVSAAEPACRTLPLAPLLAGCLPAAVQAGSHMPDALRHGAFPPKNAGAWRLPAFAPARPCLTCNRPPLRRLVSLFSLMETEDERKTGFCPFSMLQVMRSRKIKL